MERYYYIALDIGSFLVPFLFSFERRWMYFIRYWKPFFLSIFTVGAFFIIWDIYFAYAGVWSFNDRYLLGFRLMKLPLEEWLFFFLIPYASNFIHYALEYFLPRFRLGRNCTQYITLILFAASASVAVINRGKVYTLCSFGLFASLVLLQLVFRWSYARRYYLSFVIIYIPFYFVNSALTGRFSTEPVVIYSPAENLGIRLGTIPLEDSFYCFTMLYSGVVLFELFKKKWDYCMEIAYKKCLD